MDRHPRGRCALRIVLGGAVGPRPAHGVTDRSGGSVRFGRVPDHGRLSSAIDPADVAVIQQRLGAGSRHQVVLATVAAFVARAASATSLEVAYSDPEIQATVTDADALFPAWVPLHVPIASDASFTTVARAVLDDLAAVSERRTFARDIVGRTPALRAIGARALPENWPIRLAVGAIPPGSPAAAFGITVADDGQRIEWQANNGAVSPWALEALAHQFQVFLHAVVADGNQPLDRYPLVDAVDRERMLVEWNSTARDYPREACIHQLFEAEARRSPDARAVIFEGTSITYAELNARANRIARRLVGLGVRPGTIVGLAVPRSVDMVASALAVLKAGGAYLPLDPEYPADRLRFMIEDSEAPVVIASTRADVQGGDLSVQVLALDDAAEREAIDQLPASDLCVAAASGDLAYLIYTSGSTGRPKGVMVEHRQVVDLFRRDGPADRARPAWRLAGGHEPVVRHLRPRNLLDARARLHSVWCRVRRATRPSVEPTRSPPGVRLTSACSISPATRATVAPPSTGC